MRVDEFWQEVRTLCGQGQRPGQAVFNTLWRHGLAPAGLAGSLADPFYRVRSMAEAGDWADRHVVLVGSEIVRVEV